jgi:ABC-2 type transport system permease protein
VNFVRVLAVVRRHWIVLQRAPHRWFEISFWPIVDCLLWGSLGVFIARQGNQSQAGTAYLLAGLTFFWVFTQAQFSIALGVNEETWTRNLLNVSTTPIREVEYITGVALFGLIKLILCTLTLSLVTGLVFSFTLLEVGAIGIPIGLLLIVNGWALGLIAVGLVLRYGQSAEILIWGLNYMLLAFSGVFFPSDSLPAGIRAFSSILPTSRLFAMVRTAVDGAPLDRGALGIAAVGSAVFFVLSLGFAVRLLALFRRRGFITRYS